jgi:hypothetical protein
MKPVEEVKTYSVWHCQRGHEHYSEDVAQRCIDKWSKPARPRRTEERKQEMLRAYAAGTKSRILASQEGGIRQATVLMILQETAYRVVKETWPEYRRDDANFPYGGKEWDAAFSEWHALSTLEQTQRAVAVLDQKG